mgnify:CR=1 FL=1
MINSILTNKAQNGLKMIQKPHLSPLWNNRTATIQQFQVGEGEKS